MAGQQQNDPFNNYMSALGFTQNESGDWMGANGAGFGTGQFVNGRELRTDTLNSQMLQNYQKQFANFDQNNLIGTPNDNGGTSYSLKDYNKAFDVNGTQYVGFNPSAASGWEAGLAPGSANYNKYMQQIKEAGFDPNQILRNQEGNGYTYNLAMPKELSDYLQKANEDKSFGTTLMNGPAPFLLAAGGLAAVTAPATGLFGAASSTGGETAAGASSSLSNAADTAWLDQPWAESMADAAISAPGSETLGELSLLDTPGGAAYGGSVSFGDYVNAATEGLGIGSGASGGNMNITDILSGGNKVLKGVSAIGDVLNNVSEIDTANKSRGDFGVARDAATYNDDPSAYLNSPLARAQLDELNRQLMARNAKLGKTFHIDPTTQRIVGSGTGFQDWTNEFQANMGKMYEAEMERRRAKAALESGADYNYAVQNNALRNAKDQNVRNITGNVLANAGNIWDAAQTGWNIVKSWF